MKLVRWGAAKEERPGLVDADGVVRDLSGHVEDIAGAALDPAYLTSLANLEAQALPVVPEGTRLGPCVGRIGKVVCIGLNYADHAAEAGAEVPPEPVVFMKATTSVVGPDDIVLIPPGSEKTDWEVELGVVIGREARRVSTDAALDHVAGYCVVNDLSERSYQLERHGTWDKGKGCDTFCPLGPWLVTRDEAGDPQDLAMYLEVNGHRFQSGSTRTMVYKVDYLVSYVSQFMTLEPGDIISTGTPPGVGMGQTPPVFLRPGDSMELGIAGLGTQRQKVAAAV